MNFERSKAENAEFLSEEVKPLFRGVWADNLYNGQELPISGSIFTDELENNLKLDFENFDEELENYTPDSMREFFEDGENREQYEEYLNTYEADIDSYLHYVCFQVQKKVESLMQVDPLKRTDMKDRQQFITSEVRSLSEMKGKSACAERAALAQYLLQRVGFDSSYMSGVWAVSRDLEAKKMHSFIVLRDVSGDGYIFDIANPHDGSGMPSIYKLDDQFDYETFSGEHDLLVQGKEVLSGESKHFGVGEGQFVE